MELGLDVPLHRSLTVPLLLAGAPRQVTITVGTLAAALGLGLGQILPGLALWIAAQSLAAYCTRRDPAFLAVTLRHLRLKGYLAC